MTRKRLALGAVRSAVAAIALLATAVPAQACGLALLLALDVSSSVDSAEHRLQNDGLAAALTDPVVMEQILGQGGIWLAAFEWSGKRKQRILIDWTHLNSLPEIADAARRIRGAGRSTTEFPTSLGYALGFAAVFMQQAPPSCARKVIDIAGDGVNNDGFPPSSAYRAFDFTNVTVNGLVIRGADPDPVEYYAREVVRGPGSFLELAEGYADYAQAMRRKLIREVSGGAFAMVE